MKNYGNKIGSRKEVEEWKQVKDDVQGLLNVEQKLILSVMT